MFKLLRGIVVFALAFFLSYAQSYAATPAAPKAAPNSSVKFKTSPYKVIKVATVAGPSAVLTWTAPTVNTDGTTIVDPITYNVYQGTSATALTEVQTGVTGLTVTITSGLTDNTTVYWAVTAVVDGIESAQSAPGSKTFPAGVPSAPVLTVQ